MAVRQANRDVTMVDDALLDCTLIIVPAYNEESAIVATLAHISDVFRHVVCINDGSLDGTRHAVARIPHVTLLSHCVNIGQGGALETGIRHGLDNGFEYFITMDADGQHLVEDAILQLERVANGDVDIVLGSRFVNEATGVPPLRKLMLRAGAAFTRWVTGLDVTDTHNGLRTFNRSVAECMQFQHKDMGHASNVYSIVAAGSFRYIELPTRIQYTRYSLAKGQSLVNAVNILFNLLLYRR